MCNAVLESSRLHAATNNGPLPDVNKVSISLRITASLPPLGSDLLPELHFGLCDDGIPWKFGSIFKFCFLFRNLRYLAKDLPLSFLGEVLSSVLSFCVFSSLCLVLNFPRELPLKWLCFLPPTFPK